MAHAFYRARLIEHWGTGTLRVIRACEGSDIKVKFSIQAGLFVVRLLVTGDDYVECTDPLPDGRNVPLQAPHCGQAQGAQCETILPCQEASLSGMSRILS